jgi:hypothetical protein
MVKVQKVKKLNRKDVEVGNVYSVVNTVLVEDVDGDGVSDITLTHQVDKNGGSFVEASVTWYGIIPGVVEQFLAKLKELGFEDGTVTETKKFGNVVKEWKKITEFLKHINELADAKVAEVDG